MKRNIQQTFRAHHHIKTKIEIKRLSYLQVVTGDNIRKAIENNYSSCLTERGKR